MRVRGNIIAKLTNPPPAPGGYVAITFLSFRASKRDEEPAPYLIRGNPVFLVSSGYRPAPA
jgi:hypothetical protein